MRKLLVLIALLGMFALNSAQENSVELFVIDSYVTIEKPYIFNLSFFATSPVKSEITIADEYSFTISDTLAEDHLFKLDLKDYRFDSTYVGYTIIVYDENDKVVGTSTNEFVLPYKDQLKSDEDTSLLTICCFGGVIFGLPSATAVLTEGDSKFSLTKEIPILTFYSGGYNYPTGYIALEYTHIFNAKFKNFLRAGYKQVFSVEPIEFISGGVSAFTTFDGYNGLSPEFTIGWFKIYNTFTLYTRYRYNFQPSGTYDDFHEITIGLYSHFFSINL